MRSVTLLAQDDVLRVSLRTMGLWVEGGKMKHRAVNVLFPGGEALPALFGNVVNHSVRL